MGEAGEQVDVTSSHMVKDTWLVAVVICPGSFTAVVLNPVLL